MAFYDEIYDQPEKLIQRLCSFVGLDPDKYPTESATYRNVINPSFNKNMPDELRRFLVKFYHPLILKLSRENGGYFTKWVEQYEEFLG